MHLVTRGVDAHGSRPTEGVDAIAHMGRVLCAIEAHSVELSRRPPHALLGTASVHASLIRGGRELSTYPDVCELDLERRTRPGETRHGILREMAQILEALGRDPQFEAELDLSAYSAPHSRYPSKTHSPKASKRPSSAREAHAAS